jgi:predicted metal-dependent enzyme (double-stranded beta helix superfamily)
MRIRPEEQPMTELAADRSHLVRTLIRDTREILDATTMSRTALDGIRANILAIAARQELWNEADYPSPEPGEQQNRFLIGQEGPNGISLYLNVLRAGKKIPPHNHTTWACIAAVDGIEHNTLYDRLDDGSAPGKAEIRAREVVAVEPGTALAMLPDDVHSVEIKGDQIIRHLHFYGRPLETLDKRVTFDIENGTCKIMQMAVKTKV